MFFILRLDTFMKYIFAHVLHF